MSDSYVTSGAILRCSFGDKTAKLTVYPDRTVDLTTTPMANISDRVPKRNIAPFGKCRTTSYPPTGSATAANHGRLTPMPCVPGTVTDWINGKNDYIVKGKPALLKSSYCRCKWGGVITIVNDGQRDTGSADLSKENVMTEEEMKAKSEGNTGLNPDSVLDGIQMALDAAGFIPGVGAIPDLLNASISALRGDWAAAGLSVLAAVPVVGDAAAAAKFARNGVKIAKKAKQAGTATKTANMGQPFGTLTAQTVKKAESANTSRPLLSVTQKTAGEVQVESVTGPKFGDDWLSNVELKSKKDNPFNPNSEISSASTSPSSQIKVEDIGDAAKPKGLPNYNKLQVDTDRETKILNQTKKAMDAADQLPKGKTIDYKS